MDGGGEWWWMVVCGDVWWYTCQMHWVSHWIHHHHHHPTHQPTHPPTIIVHTPSARTSRRRWVEAASPLRRSSCSMPVTATFVREVSFIRRARRILRTSGKIVGTLFPETAAVSLISKTSAGAPTVASDGRDTRSVQTSSGNAQLAWVATGITRRTSLRALFGS